MRNRHHVLWPKSAYSKGYAKRLREHCVYSLDIDTHAELHQTIKTIPVPQDVKYLFTNLPQGLTLLEMCAWLWATSEDEKFKQAMKIQYNFLKKHPL